jgi:hypothetical protein
MERAIKKLQEIESSNNIKEILKKVDVNNYRQGLNTVLEKEWDLKVRRACLAAGTKENPFVSELYWINTLQAHTFKSALKQINKLIKDFPDNSHKILADDAISIIHEYQEKADLAASYKERLKTQVIPPKADKDPIAALPPASREAMVKIRDLLADKCEGLKEEIRQSYHRSLTGILSEYLDMSDEDKSKPLYKSYLGREQKIPMLMRMLHWDHMSGNKAVKSDDADNFIEKESSQSANDTVQTYVHKHTVKLAGVIQNMLNISAISLNVNSDNGRIEGQLGLSFDDGRSFDVRSQVVLSYSTNGLLFARYPTTFHDVINENGSLEGKMLSESEMRDWSQKNDMEMGM